MTTHGKSLTVEHATWKRMRQRCLSSAKRFKYWNGRGITICKRWDKFENFLEDMGKRPGKGYSLDRIDNNKGYSPENCRWATNKQQASNTRKNRFITYKGETKTISDWCKILKTSCANFARRLDRWTLEEAFETPKPTELDKKSIAEIKKSKLSSRALGKKYGVSKTTILRVRNNTYDKSN